MCLYIDYDRHHKKNFFGKFVWKPERVSKPIKVYKVLMVNTNTEEIRTPFQMEKLNFEGTKCVFKKFQKKDFITKNETKDKHGYHSFTNQSDASIMKDELTRAEGSLSVFEYIILEGYIPKGSYVYRQNPKFCRPSAICSNQLVVEKAI